MPHLAKVSNDSGLRIHIPKQGNALMLFMEWIAENKKVIQKTRTRKRVDFDGFTIEFNAALLSEYIDCRDYINANL